MTCSGPLQGESCAEVLAMVDVGCPKAGAPTASVGGLAALAALLGFAGYRAARRRS
jgi:MYXO-CTERM domain-containing protein